ncbi:MAG: RecQ family ATP-dependent DNA helicase [Acidobacteriaceae bacterium]|nr:RecQ family ATP-dependent DNA helicase [Acidobacteriaceae bacterium]
MTDLTSLLHTTFGFPAFRANQEAVCRAATDGRDALLVMPTGAGKSLCYQLPAIARGGTALVISPLIALMDDQAGKLAEIGLKVARIHSGLSREDSRQSCRDYLDGVLNFLFIAPERMRVPGFPEMLARRKPSLIAIDEAHCISAWGHDFRPDYRTLGEHLPALRPAPIIALTATATPTVQQDIVAQLSLQNPALFIHGFRRSNLAIEVVEMSKPRRHEFTAKLLREPASRPAIVYAPSRKAAEDLASDLARRFPAAAYHAGLEPSVRERVQTEFQSGKLEVVVATIAFGMGIDKADVRTVVHTSLPASVEAFYQEIGRAGRDGLPSRTILLHSYADIKMHEFFLERDYPPAADLTRVAKVLTDEYLMPEPLAQKLRMDLGSFSKAIEKLIAQGAASIDIAGNIRRATPKAAKPESWTSGYQSQIAFRRSQIDRMIAFADAQQCRMTALIRHFGDTADSTRPCGICDVCNPTGATAQSFRPPNDEDLRQLAAILAALEGQSRSTGKLYTELSTGALRNTEAGRDRKNFDTLLDALSRAALIDLTAETFTNPEGNVIPYKKVSLTYEGREAASTGKIHAPDILLQDAESGTTTAKAKKSSSAKPSKASLKAEREQTTAAYTPAQRQLDESLRAWRKAEAAKTGKPAFIVFGDAVLANVVRANPQTISELLTVSGIGPEKADKFGAEIIALCRADGTTTSVASQPAEKQPASTKTKRKTAEPSVQPERTPGKQAARTARSGVENAPQLSHSANTPSQPTESFHRSRPTAPVLAEDLTSAQQQLDEALHAWRKSESERIGLPQFFVLGSSALRSIVLKRPRTIAQLQSIPGIGPDKAEKFGASIVALCNA